MSKAIDFRFHVQPKQALAERLRQIRLEQFGDEEGPELTRILNIPLRTWLNYESGVTIPGEVLLAFLVATNVDPCWLLRGEGAKFRATS